MPYGPRCSTRYCNSMKHTQQSVSGSLQELGHWTQRWLPHGSALGRRLYSKLYGSRWETVQIWPHAPQLRDRKERDLIRALLPSDGVFLDIGANSGAYSHWAAQQLSEQGVVLAIEADVQTHQVLQENVLPATNRAQCRMYLENVGLSNTGTLALVSLMSVVKKHGLGRVDFMQINIDGFDLKVLSKFFADCNTVENRELRPRHVLIEIEDGRRARDREYTRNLKSLLEENGYSEFCGGQNSLYTDATRIRLRPLPPNPMVSIVTPSYNTGAYLAETLRSVQNQDYPHVEHIVLDANSTDQTLDVLAQFPSVRVVKGAPAGMCEKVNLGLSMARGDIVAWLCADDLYLPEAISKAVDALKNNPEAALVYCNSMEVDEHTVEICRTRSRPTSHQQLVHEHGYIPLPTVFIRREALEAVGPVDVRFQLVSDWDLWIRISRIFPLLYVDDWWAAFRRRPGQLSDTFTFTVWLQGRRMVRSYGAPFVPRRPLSYWGRMVSRAMGIIRKRIVRALGTKLRGGAGEAERHADS
jgi:glycosyltransferase involved in cell wall biosynthesis